MNNLLI